jgi:hypothetical protein
MTPSNATSGGIGGTTRRGLGKSKYSVFGVIKTATMIVEVPAVEETMSGILAMQVAGVLVGGMKIEDGRGIAIGEQRSEMGDALVLLWIRHMRRLCRSSIRRLRRSDVSRRIRTSWRMLCSRSRSTRMGERGRIFGREAPILLRDGVAGHEPFKRAKSLEETFLPPLRAKALVHFAINVK